MINKILCGFSVLSMSLIGIQSAHAAFSAQGGIRNLGCAVKASETLKKQTGIQDGQLKELVPGQTYQIQVQSPGKTTTYTLVAPPNSFDPEGCGDFIMSSAL